MTEGEPVRVRPEQENPREAGPNPQDPTTRTGEAPLSGETVPESDGTPERSEQWVEGQQPSEADYGEDPESRDPTTAP
jgi:hypothetical protein